MPSDPPQSFEGRYSDGQTAAAVPVLVCIDSETLTARAQDGTLRASWPFDELVSAGPLDRHGDAQIGIERFPGALIHVADAAFAPQLLGKAPQLSPRAEHRRILYPLFGFLLLTGLGLALLWQSGWSPARSIASLMSDDMRRGLGRDVVRLLTDGKPACRNPAGLAALDHMLARLNEGYAEQDHFTVIVADLGMINAFAAPGEQVVVGSELVEFVETPEELAGIIAHEMGHGAERHPEIGIVRSMGISALISLFTGGSSSQIGNLGGFLLQLGYSREAERAADRHALARLKAAGLPAQPFARFFIRIDRKMFGEEVAGSAGDGAPDKAKEKGEGKSASKDEGAAKDAQTAKAGKRTLRQALDLFSTHPPLPERVRTINAQPAYPLRPLLSDAEWQALRSICK